MRVTKTLGSCWLGLLLIGVACIDKATGPTSTTGGSQGNGSNRPPSTPGQTIVWTRDARLLPLTVTDSRTGTSVGTISQSMTSAPACGTVGSVTIQNTTEEVALNAQSSAWGSWSLQLSTMTGCQSQEVVLTPVTLSIAGAGSGSGTIRSATGAISCTIIMGAAAVDGCTSARNSGSTYGLVATPAAGSAFFGWRDLSFCATIAAGETCSVRVNRASTLTAEFRSTATPPTTPLFDTLSVIVEWSRTNGAAGAARVVSDPSGIDCTSTSASVGRSCTAVFARGTTVTLTASATSDASWSGWGTTGSTSQCANLGNTTCRVTLSGRTEVARAVFVPASPPTVVLDTLLVSADWIRMGGTAGTGRVVSNPTGIDCSTISATAGRTCTGLFARGSSVTLSVTASNGAFFSIWGGTDNPLQCELNPASAICGIVMRGPTSAPNGTMMARALFMPQIAPSTVTLGINITGAGSGSIQSTIPDSRIGCFKGASSTATYAGAGGACGASFTTGTTVTLSALELDAESDFDGWTGACAFAGKADTCRITLSAAMTVGATFAGTQRTGRLSVWTNYASAITVSVAGRAYGTIPQYFSSVTPTCGQVGTLTLTLAAGTHAVVGTSGTLSWNVQGIVTAGGCQLLKLNAPNDGNGNGSGANYSTPSTQFLSRQDAIFSKSGDWLAVPFTLRETRRFVFRFAADFAAQAAIIAPAQLASFQSNAAFTGIAIFDKTSGVRSVQLAPGTYYAAIRNATNGANGYSYELDYEIGDVLINPELGSRFTFSNHYVNTSVYVAKNNGWYVQPFSIQAGLRYFLDGVNSGGLSCYIIPASEVQNFRSGDVFQQFSTYKAEASGYCPGLQEIRLPPGDYAVALRNPTGINRAVVVTMDRWRITP